MAEYLCTVKQGRGGEASLNGFQRLSSVFVMHQGSQEVARVPFCSWICHQHCTTCCTGHKYHFCCVAFLVFTHTYMSSDSHWPFYDCKSKNMWSSNQILGPYIFFLLMNTSATCYSRLCHDDCEFWRTAGLLLNMSSALHNMLHRAQISFLCDMLHFWCLYCTHICHLIEVAIKY